MSSSSNRYQFAKKELLKISIAILVLMVASIVYYFYIRKEALHLAEKRAEITLKSIERMILINTGRIETTVNAMLPMAQYALDKDPDAMYGIARHIVESNPRVTGAGVAFKANYYPEKGRWFEAYTGYQNRADTLVTEQLGGPKHDYLQMEWFKKGMKSKDGFWSDPYYDDVDGKSFVISYCLPVSDSFGEVVGVICTDVTLDTLASVVRSVEIYPNSFCTLSTTDGELLVGPPSSRQVKGKFHVFSEKVDKRNMILTLTVPDSDMYKRLRKSILFFTFMALTGIFSVLFISYRSVQNLWKLNEVQLKEQHIEDELTIARNIQQSLLPSGIIPIIGKRLDVNGFQAPARFVGGDLFDYYVRDGKLFFCIGDVSGKGVPAALLMAIAHSLFRTLSARVNRPESIMQALNTSISDNNPDIMFITMFLGVMDLSTGKITYCNAGHNPPVLIQNGVASLLDTEPSLLLGIDYEARYEAHELSLSPGDTLFLYTDGLTEAENIQKELFGEGRMLETAAANSGLSADEQLGKMREAVQQFAGDAEQSDDLTFLVIRYNSASPVQTLTLTNDIRELDRLEPFLEDFFERNNLDPLLLPSVNLALEEALANVIMYAYPKEVPGEVILSAMVKEDNILMEIRDMGIPFNPLNREEVNLDVSLEERPIGGLGIHLIKEIMDEVEYARESGRNVLKMRKKAIRRAQ